MLLASTVGVAIDVAIIALIVLFAIIGFHKGFFKSVISMISTVVVIIVSIVFASPLANLFNKIYDFTGLIAGKLCKAIASMGTFYSQTIPEGVSGKDIVNNIPASTNGFLKKLMSYVLNPLEASEIQGATVADIVSGAFASIIMIIISGIILFIAIKIVLALASRLFDNITRNRVFGATNKLLGLVFGGVKGFIIVIVFTIILTFMTVVPFINTKLSPIIQDNTHIAKPIYNYTDEMVEKYVIDGKIVQKWIDKLWDNKYNGKNKDEKPENPAPQDPPVTPSGTLENPHSIDIGEGVEGVFTAVITISFETEESQYYKLEPSGIVQCVFNLQIDTTVDYEVYNVENTEEKLTDISNLHDGNSYIIKFIKGTENSVEANLTLTQNK